MPSRARRRLPWVLGWLLAAAAGSAWLAQQSLVRQDEALDTDARIVHRLLSQRTVQHDAVLAMLALLQPDGLSQPEQRLPALDAQVPRVLRREPAGAWPTAAWDRAEAESRALRRAVLAEADLAAGRSTLLIAAEPASFALELDLRRAVPAAEWPIGETNTLAMMETAQKNSGAANLVDIPGFLLLGGGVPVKVGNEVIGAVGVGGAPGGQLDEQCALAALDKVKDLLK